MPAIAIQENRVADEIANGDELGTVQIAREMKLDVATVFRWINKGLPAANGCRVHLEAIHRGKKWLTSRAALSRFFASLPTNANKNNEISPRANMPFDRSSEKRETDRQQAAATRRSKYGF